MEPIDRKETSSTEPTREIIDQHVAANNFWRTFKSKILAAFLCAGIAGFLAYLNEFAWFGPHSVVWSFVAGFVIGGILGERTVFFLLGALVAYFFAPDRCPP